MTVSKPAYRFKNQWFIYALSAFILFSVSGCAKCVECHRNIFCAVCNTVSSQKNFSSCSSEFNDNASFFYFLDRQHANGFRCTVTKSGEDVDKICRTDMTGLGGYISEKEKNGDYDCQF